MSVALAAPLLRLADELIDAVLSSLVLDLRDTATRCLSTCPRLGDQRQECCGS